MTSTNTFKCEAAGAAQKAEPGRKRTGTIQQAYEAFGLPRATIYRLLADGRILAVKANRRTLLLWDSLDEYIASLPQASFGSRKT